MKELFVLFALNILFIGVYSQVNDSISSKLSRDLEQIYAQEHIVGFSLAIVNSKGALYEKGFGYADKHANKKYTKHSIQNIASISKTFIGIALLKAQELGKLQLNDPINDYLPFQVINPRFPNTPITIRHLATHTSSIKDPIQYEKFGYILKDANHKGAKANRNFRSPNDMMAHELYLESILDKQGKWYSKKTFLKNKPGELFEYSNIAAGLAAFVLENATNETFAEFTHKHIFKPLNMKNTAWSFNEVDFTAHTKLYKDTETELAFYKLVNYPDGGLLTSTAELGKYLSELISGYNGNGKLLSTESYNELFHPQLSDKNYTDRSSNTYNDEYNMGIFMGMSADSQIGHTGGDPGVTTLMFFNAKTNIGKLLFVNTSLNKEGVKELIDIWNKLEENENLLETN